MGDSYENLPVFRMSNYSSPDDVIGKADVDISDSGKATITMEVDRQFVDFLNLGRLKALSLSGFVDSVDPEKAKEYWSRQQQ